MLNKRRITIKGDRVLEADELFGVRLSAPVNAHLADGTGWGTIQNDDSAPAPAQSPGLSSPSGGNSWIQTKRPEDDEALPVAFSSRFGHL